MDEIQNTDRTKMGLSGSEKKQQECGHPQIK